MNETKKIWIVFIVGLLGMLGLVVLMTVEFRLGTVLLQIFSVVFLSLLGYLVMRRDRMERRRLRSGHLIAVAVDGEDDTKPTSTSPEAGASPDVGAMPSTSPEAGSSPEAGAGVSPIPPLPTEGLSPNYGSTEA